MASELITKLQQSKNKMANVPSDKSIISQKLVDLCNYRIQQEEYSSRLYSSMSRWLDDKSYVGASKLWNKYAQEELKHAEVFYQFLLYLGIRPITPDLDSPQQDFENLLQIVQLSYEHEVEIYRQCAELANIAFSENNLLLYPIALDFTKEQGEELGKIQLWLDMFKSFGTEQITLLHIDEKMGELAG